MTKILDQADRSLAGSLAELAYQASQAEHIDLVPRDKHVIERYQRCRHWRLFPGERMFRHLHAAGLAGKHVLEFGCGDGTISTLLGQFRARVTGLDISAELIEVAKRRAQLDGVQDRVEFVVQDIAHSPLEAGRFDILVCHAALHHVEAELVPQLMATLKPGGLAVIAEPIAFSPALQWLRDCSGVQKDVSPDERQLSQEEICAITGLLREPDVTFFNLFGRVSRFFPYANKIDHGHALTRNLILALFGTDRVILDIAPAVSRFCGTVVIAGKAR